MNFRPLSEQVVLLTGATSGIGLATARRLSEGGAKLILVARGAEDCAALAAELPQALAAPADVADAEALGAAAQAGIDRWGRIDTWINDAGVAIYGRVEEVPVEDQRRLFETNYWGALNGMLEAVRLHRAGSGPAKIVTLGSQLSDRSMIFQGPYSASKHAVKAVTDALRMEVEREGLDLSITLVKPGSVDTPYMEHARSYLDAEGTVNPPRAYAPEVVADGIAWACTHHIRDLDVGGAGWLTAKAGRIAPRLTDLGMELLGKLLQTSDQPPRPGMRDNLETSARAGETRSNQPGPRARETSLLMQAQMHPVGALAVAGGALAVAALIAGRTRRGSGAPAAAAMRRATSPLVTSTIREVAAPRDDLFAFEITGTVTRDDMAAMGRRMIDVFDAAPGKVDMLLIFDRFEGSEPLAGLSWLALRSRTESLWHVHRYVTAAAPAAASAMVEAMGHVMPVKAEAFDTAAEAWRFLGVAMTRG